MQTCIKKNGSSNAQSTADDGLSVIPVLEGQIALPSDQNAPPTPVHETSQSEFSFKFNILGVIGDLLWRNGRSKVTGK